MPTALVALCKTNIFVPYIHHTIQKWGLDLWVIRCPMSLLQPNKDSSTWNLKSYKCEGLDKYRTSSPHRPTLDYFLKTFTSFMFQAVPQKSQPWTGEGHTLCSWQRLMSHRAPSPTARPARAVAVSRDPSYKECKTGQQRKISRCLCICLKSTVRQINSIIFIIQFQEQRDTLHDLLWTHWNSQQVLMQR